MPIQPFTSLEEAYNSAVSEVEHYEKSLEELTTKRSETIKKINELHSLVHEMSDVIQYTSGKLAVAEHMSEQLKRKQD